MMNDMLKYTFGKTKISYVLSCVGIKVPVFVFFTTDSEKHTP